MGLKKFKDLFNKSSGKEQKSHLSAASTSKKDDAMEPERLRSTKDENLKTKLEVEQLQKLINQKLKDPAMAKKAAQILEEMLNKGGK